MMKEQIKAYKKFCKLKVGSLFMEMGTGKTKVAIDLVNYNNVDLLIYVAPFSTLANIEDELKKWGLNCEYILIGYETISSSDRKYIELKEKLINKKCFIIADESIFIKNEETKRFKRLCDLRKKCKYALILNGTPLTNNEWDLYNQMYFLSPLILKMTRQEFLNTFFKKITYKKKHEEKKIFYKFSNINIEFLNKLIAPYIFESKLYFNKEEEVVYNYIYITMDYYDYTKESILEEMKELCSLEKILTLLNKLNKISSISKEKNDELCNYVKDKQLIVYCNYLEEIDYIASKIDCFVISGNVKKRKEIIEQFKISNKPLIMTYGTGAYSLNLQFCNEIVYSSLNFDYAKYEQSKFRIKRIGQERNIKYTYFLSKTGINDFIKDNLERKRNLSDIIKIKFMEGDVEWLKYI